MRRNTLPPGFRFHPTDVELVKYYLKKKVLGKKLPSAIADVDIYKYAPWDLPDKSCLKSGDLKWYFFCPREKKYASGFRTNRSTDFGYWKTTGKDRPVHYKNVIAGSIKTLVFHAGKPPKGDRTDWVMHEYKLEEQVLSNGGVVHDSYVLCVIFKKDGPGPKNGAQYGAPFNEEEWEEDIDDEEETNCVEEILHGAVAGPTSASLSFFNRSAITSACVLETPCVGPSASCPSENHVSVYYSPTVVNDNVCASTDTPEAFVTNAIPAAPLGPQILHELDNSVTLSASQVALEEDNLAATSVATEVMNREEPSLNPQVSFDVSELLSAFLVEDSSNPSGCQDARPFPSENDETNLQMDDFCHGGSNLEAIFNTNGSDIYDSLGDLGNLNGHNNYYDGRFLELQDLEHPVPYFNEVNAGGQFQPAGSDGYKSQLFDHTDFFNAADLITELNQPTPLPLNGSHGFENQHDAFWTDGGPCKKARRDC